MDFLNLMHVPPHGLGPTQSLLGHVDILSVRHLTNILQLSDNNNFIIKEGRCRWRLALRGEQGPSSRVPFKCNRGNY